MDKTIIKAPSGGKIKAIPSKSMAHRMMICAALTLINDLESARKSIDSLVALDKTSKDIEATRGCLKEIIEYLIKKCGSYKVAGALSSKFRTDSDSVIRPGESGSTLRFLLPILGALDIKGKIEMEGRLKDRPLSPMYEELIAHGMQMSAQGENPFFFEGKLKGGKFSIKGDVSSQFISGLLFALPLCNEDSELEIVGEMESKSYVDMTLDVLLESQIKIEKRGNTFYIKGNQKYQFPLEKKVEGDWSNAAFWLSLGALLNDGITVSGLLWDSSQGDKKIIDILDEFGAIVAKDHSNGEISVRNNGNLRGIVIDAKDIPDLVPILAVVASFAKGETRIENAGRLRLKESDRLLSVSETLNKLGADIEVLPEGLIIKGVEKLKGGVVSGFNDHRIVMMAAVAATFSENPLIIQGAEAVEKSYPSFFEDFEILGGVTK